MSFNFATKFEKACDDLVRMRFQIDGKVPERIEVQAEQLFRYREALAKERYVTARFQSGRLVEEDPPESLLTLSILGREIPLVAVRTGAGPRYHHRSRRR